MTTLIGGLLIVAAYVMGVATGIGWRAAGLDEEITRLRDENRRLREPWPGPMEGD